MSEIKRGPIIPMSAESPLLTHTDNHPLDGFLMARIAEDEAANLVGPEPESWCDRGEGLHLGNARMAAECDAKRRIVANHSHTVEARGCGCSDCGDRVEIMDCDVCCEASMYVTEGGWCLTLRALALPYADHEAYRSEWRP